VAAFVQREPSRLDVIEVGHDHHDSDSAARQDASCRIKDWRGSCWSSVEVRPRNATRTSSRNNAAGTPSGHAAQSDSPDGPDAAPPTLALGRRAPMGMPPIRGAREGGGRSDSTGPAALRLSGGAHAAWSSSAGADPMSRASSPVTAAPVSSARHRRRRRDPRGAGHKFQPASMRIAAGHDDAGHVVPQPCYVDTAAHSATR
jgi:hypothetical protein